MAFRVGILRCLLYYPFYPLWHRFFSELGFDIEVSPPITGELFDSSPRRYVVDICLPIESAFVHAEVIKGKADFLFVPQVNRLHRDVYVCPACAGLPFILPRNIPDLPELLTPNLTPFHDLDRNDIKPFRKLGLKSKAVKAAYRAAQRDYFDFVEEARSEPHLDRAIVRFTGQEPERLHLPPPKGRHILLLGMPYVLGDHFINQGIPRLLSSRNCRLTTPFMVVPELANQEIELEDYWLYWTFGGMSIAALMELIGGRSVDGVIYCSSFACGVDSLITPIVQSACRRCCNLPFLQLVLDEHAEVAHLEVRIEAFLDSLEPVHFSRGTDS